MTTPAALIDVWLAARASPEALAWLGGLLEHARAGNSGLLGLGFSQLLRRLGSGALALAQRDCERASAVRPGWQPGAWTVDQLGRARVALELADQPLERYRTGVERLFEDADLAEQVALYQALAVLPEPALWVARAAEGIRSNMKAVFDAVALDNPFPAQFFSEAQFNQLVLKCLFVGSPLHRVWGLDGRLNVALAQMLCDYARERWAAGRAVSPELWRAVGPVAHGEMLDLLARAMRQGTSSERAAVVLSALDNKEAESLLSEQAELLSQARKGELSWKTIATG